MVDSIIVYIEGNPGLLRDYFKKCKGVSKQPNYSEFCREYLEGEAFDGTKFDSIYVDRGSLTRYIQNEYNMWEGLSLS